VIRLLKSEMAWSIAIPLSGTSYTWKRRRI
jgi:hypothetical protein